MALAAALVWSLSVILFKHVDTLSASGLNLFKNTVAIVLLLVTMALLGEPFEMGRSTTDWIALAVSGIVGIAIADTMFFAALSRMGAGALAVVECAYSPLVVVSSMLLLSERPSLPFFGGTLLVVGGVLLVSLRDGRSAVPQERRRFLEGVAYGVASVGMMGVAIVIAKPAIERSNLIEVTTVRLILGNLALLPWIARNRSERRAALALFRPQRNWRHLVPAAVLGTYLAMIFWVGGMKYTSASTAAVLNQLSTVFTLLLSWWLLKEPLTRLRMIGGATAMGGAMVILATT